MMIVSRGPCQERPRRGWSGLDGMKPRLRQRVQVATGAVLEMGTEGRLRGQPHP